MHDLPPEILIIIYSFDNTYKEFYKKILIELIDLFKLKTTKKKLEISKILLSILNESRYKNKRECCLIGWSLYNIGKG